MDREKERETTTSIYRNHCNIHFDHRTQGKLGKRGDTGCMVNLTGRPRIRKTFER